MPPRLPQEVQGLLTAEHPAVRDAAWESFVASHSRLMLHVARSVTRDGDEAMDAYAWTLERLKEGDSRRLRGFSEVSGTQFATWLVVVVRRLCLDFVRHKRGRRPKTPPQGLALERSQLRKRLVDLAGEPAALDRLWDPASDPGAELQLRELREALDAAVGSLPPADKLLLSLRFEDLLSASEIARIMKFPSQFHVYRRLEAVLKALRQGLAAKGIDSAEP